MFKSQEKLIAEIHNEFDTAQERLLTQANQVLTSISKQPEEIAFRLKSIGFTNTPTVKKVEKNREIKQMAQSEAELVQYYKQTYPFLKFLTETELERICGKYNLIFAKAERYVKEVPEKNLRDIEQAQALKEDDAINASELRRKRLERERWGNGEGLRSIHFDYPYYTPSWVNQDIERKKGLFIAAPKSHFNLKGLVKTSLFGWGKPEVKDPIVFRYVRGGIQVLTKWGLESEDPLLYNDKLN